MEALPLVECCEAHGEKRGGGALVFLWQSPKKFQNRAVAGILIAIRPEAKRAVWPMGVRALQIASPTEGGPSEFLSVKVSEGDFTHALNDEGFPAGRSIELFFVSQRCVSSPCLSFCDRRGLWPGRCHRPELLRGVLVVEAVCPDRGRLRGVTVGRCDGLSPPGHPSTPDSSHLSPISGFGMKQWMIQCMPCLLLKAAPVLR